jgi:hypothetical protein
MSCLPLGGIAWLHQTTAFHRRELTHCAGRIANAMHDAPDRVRTKLEDRAQGQSVTKWVRVIDGEDGSQWVFFRNGPYTWVETHTIAADAYERAACRPWILLSHPIPPPDALYVQLTDEVAWRAVAPPVIEAKGR